MSSVQKEQIYVELRKYHLDEFPESLSNASMNDLLSEYRILEDEVITMLLELVNGKSEYVDLSDKLNNFIDKAKPGPKGNKTEEADRKHFVDKSNQLVQILQMAQDASFKLRPPRKTRESSRKVITTVNKT
jgi:hypothetical protein